MDFKKTARSFESALKPLFYEVVFGLFTPANVSCVNFGYAPITPGLAAHYPNPDEALQYELYWQTFALLERQLSAQQVLCEISCGRGGGLAFLRGSTAARLIGLERSWFACRHARRRFGLDVRAAVAPKLPLAAQSVDVFLCVDSAHIYHTPEFVAELVRCLKPGGCVLLADRNRGAPDYVRKMIHKRHAAAGLTLDTWRDIGANALQALYLDEARKQQLLRALPPLPGLRAKAENFAGLIGSQKHQDMERGEVSYFLMRSTKPDQA
ncbi:MAG: class I SAM-dependent methyltransferase [Rhodocyclaceae bacterium]|nr:class I SAM-dependent methyltransferase [Rhodocyclaceae bacterium]